jgi:class 3 adenylate cyclase
VFDGFVAEYIGDGVLIYFGYPQTLAALIGLAEIAVAQKKWPEDYSCSTVQRRRSRTIRWRLRRGSGAAPRTTRIARALRQTL